MSNLFLVLFIASFVCLLISFFKADLFYKLFKTDKKSRVITIWAIITFAFFVLTGIFAEETPKEDQTAMLEKKISSLENQLAEQKIKNEESIQMPTQEAVKEAEVVKETSKVVNVIDGDTVKLENGQVVRYIGINTPEIGNSSECFGKEASVKNEELVEGKEITLTKDVSEVDKYGRILRYIYIGDTFVNDYLVRNGFARAINYSPDEKYKDQFKEAEEEAKQNKLGLWADDACKVEEKPEPVVVAPVKTVTSTTVVSGGSYTCSCSKTCAQMSSCAEAQYQLNTCGCSKRDADKDGIACDSDCQ